MLFKISNDFSKNVFLILDLSKNAGTHETGTVFIKKF